MPTIERKLESETREWPLVKRSMYRILRVHLAVALGEALAVALVLQEAAVVEAPLVVVGHRAPGKEG
jgi:hypothetical protein